MRYQITALFILINLGLLIAQTKQSVEGNIDNLPVREYNLTIENMKVNITGKEVMGMLSTVLCQNPDYL